MLTQFITFAQTSMDYEMSADPSGEASAAVAGAMTIFLIISMAIVIIPTIIGLWKVFQKAGRPGWIALIPIYNGWVSFVIAGKPGWWVLTNFIPFVGPVIGFVLSIIGAVELAKRFGKDIGYAALLVLLPFIGYPLLGFGSAQYRADGQSGPQTPDAPTANPSAPGAGPVAPTAPQAPAASPASVAPIQGTAPQAQAAAPAAAPTQFGQPTAPAQPAQTQPSGPPRPPKLIQ